MVGYPPTRSATEQQNRDQPPVENHPTILLLMLEKEQEERERERKQLQATIDDLRCRLDEEAAERRKLTALLTHQPEQKGTRTIQVIAMAKRGVEVQRYEKLR